MDCKGVHILFCDHDPSSGSKTLAFLQKCSYKVTSVKSASQVVEVLSTHNSDVDIVLADVELPQDRCFKMLKHILGQENLNHVAVVVMSEHDDMATVATCLRLGAVDYLVKPLRLNEVMNLWTHMWRRRRTLGLPDTCAVESRSLHADLTKPDATVDLLANYHKEFSTSVTDAHPTEDSRDCIPPQLELSLKLSLDYNVEKVPTQEAIAEPIPSSPVDERVANSSAFSIYLRSSNQQPDEQSATNMGSPISCYFSEGPRHPENRGSAGRVSASAERSLDSPNETSGADESRPGDEESQVCDMHQQPTMQSTNVEERIYHTGQMPSRHVQGLYHIGQMPCRHLQGFQPCYPYIELTPEMQQSFTASVDGCAAAGYANPTLNSSQINVQPVPLYQHEAGMANVPPISNMYSYYPLAHLAVPVVSLSTLQTMIPSPPPMAGGKLLQAERREAALSKFRMKRNGRCFEKKIRYASRKKLAEQRPRIRGQFVKRTAVMELVERAVIHGGFDEDVEADDEQGCSELDDQSSPECIAR